MDAAPTAAERAAVDELVGPPAGEGRVAFAGFHQAAAQRHLLLPTLQAVQRAIGWVSPGALNYLCERLIVPPADAYGVATFYSLLSTEERPALVVHECTDIACTAGTLTAGAHASPCLGQCEQGSAAFVQEAGRPDRAIAPAPPEVIAALLRGDDVTPERSPPLRHPGPLTRRIGNYDPSDADGYRAVGGFAALEAAKSMGAAQVIAEVKASNLRGRGGAAFPAGVKWEAAAAEPARPRYLAVNADESEPGTFKDRILMEEDPFAVVEAALIAAFATGASHIYYYVRGEYPTAAARLTDAIEQCAGLVDGVTAEVRLGGGAYICGEETALFNSIEGFRGEPRQKPPFPTQAGLFGKPTVVNNVETLVNVLDIVTGGGAAFAGVGTEQSTGTKLFCLSGAVERPGLYEVPFGTSLRELLDLAGGPGDLRAVLLGGAAGVFVGPDALDAPLTFEGVRVIGATLGSGVVMPFDDSADMGRILRRIAEFFRDESCGQCVPCRVGTVRQEEVLERLLAANGDRAEHTALLDDIARVMVDASICGLGQTAAGAVQSALRLGLVDGTPR